jgi:hypothetical protein
MKKQLTALCAFCTFYLFSLITFSQPQKDSAMTSSNGVNSSEDSSYSVVSGNVSISINPEAGGRITSFKLGEYEFLSGKDVNPESYGSTFWPSPQSNWNWPPPAVLDNKPYSVVKSDSAIEMTSGKDPQTGFQFVKVFSPGKSNSINLKYSIINITNEDKKAAPWEVTRVHKGGLFFFPIGETPLGKKIFRPVPSEIINGIFWFQTKETQNDSDELTTADGSEGWFAYAIKGNLFIKKFKDIQPRSFAPGEKEISVYVDAKFDYIEIEAQGEYKDIKSQEKSMWNTKWIAAKIPSDIKVEKGNMKLVEFARNIVKQF